MARWAPSVAYAYANRSSSTRIRAVVGEGDGGADLLVRFLVDRLGFGLVEDPGRDERARKAGTGSALCACDVSAVERYRAGSTTEWPRSR